MVASRADHYLRTLANADAIHEGVKDAEEVVLIGGSYIACEVAASMTMLGKHCTLVMQEQRSSNEASAPVSAVSSRSCSKPRREGPRQR